jgi:hypothetical protein
MIHLVSHDEIEHFEFGALLPIEAGHALFKVCDIFCRGNPAA